MQTYFWRPEVVYSSFSCFHVHNFISFYTMMDDCQKNVYHEKLLHTLDEIEEFLAKSKGAAKAVSPDKSLGRLSRMEAMQDQQLLLEVRRRQIRRKAEVIAALSRLEQNLFGKCIFCKKEISSERLEVFPETQTCPECG